MNLIRTFSFLCVFMLCSSIWGQKEYPISKNKETLQDTERTTLSYKVEKEALVDSLQSFAQVGFDGIDGPYIVNDTLYRVTSENRVIVENYFDRDSIRVRVNNASKDNFLLSLQSNHEISEGHYPMPEKLVALSDIEGKFNAFTGFLSANNIIDKNHNWIFGKGHLVLLGDFVDRGKNVTAVLWLIYKLEYQARANGGRVHFILGNHEVLNFQGDHRYNNAKYIKIAQEISGSKSKKDAVKYLYSDRSELGKWLATKNVIIKIGEYLFVHGGLSPEILKYGLTVNEINSRVRSRFNKDGSKKDSITDFLYSAKGPFWYRGFAMNRLNYQKIKASELDSILLFYESKKIVIGHTVVKDVSSIYGDKIIMIDVTHGYDKRTGNTKGILIENSRAYALDDLANRTVLIR